MSMHIPGVRAARLARLAATAAVLAAVALAAGGAVLVPRTAAADAYLRVIAQKAPVHTGPGAEYREVYRAERGATFPVLERATRGYWFRVALADGTTGWILGDLVFPFERAQTAHPGLFGRMWRTTRDALLGPSPVARAQVEISFSAGVLDGEGLFLLRPAWLIDRYFALELFAGLSPRQQKDLYLGGLGWTLRMVPGAAVGPYLHAGMGVAHMQPKADNFTDPEQTLMALSAGGGFEITFKRQITVRLDARNWILFDPNQATSGQELTSGLAIFF